MTLNEYVEYAKKAQFTKHGGTIVEYCFHCNAPMDDLDGENRTTVVHYLIKERNNNAAEYRLHFHLDCFRSIAGRKYSMDKD